MEQGPEEKEPSSETDKSIESAVSGKKSSLHGISAGSNVVDTTSKSTPAKTYVIKTVKSASQGTMKVIGFHVLSNCLEYRRI